MNIYKEKNRIMECAKHCDTIYDLVQLRRHATFMYRKATTENKDFEIWWYSTLYHAAQTEIMRRNKSGRI